MESTLQGKKGQKDVLVDNLGKVIKTVKTTKASAGNNVYLTIDADLQKYAYNILENNDKTLDIFLQEFCLHI